MDSFILQNNEKSVEYFTAMLALLSESTDDYIFIWNMGPDQFYISPSILEKYDLPSAQFHGLLPAWSHIMYPSDLDRFLEDITPFVEGKKNYHELEYRLVNRQGERVWVNCRGKAVPGPGSSPLMMVGRITEISGNARADHVTGLLNQAQMELDFGDSLTADWHGCLMILGIDNFRNVNDRHGQSYGDRLLKLLSGIIEDNVEAGHRIYRLDGDKFAIFLPGYSTQQVRDQYAKIQASFADTCHKLEKNIFCTVSAGAAAYPQDSETYGELVRYAESALGSAKQMGKNNLVLFTMKDYEQHLFEIDLQDSLQRCIKNNFEGFQLYYQPQVDVRRGSLVGAEALIRWSSPELSGVPPIVVVSTIEKMGLMQIVGEWILEQAIQQCKAWRSHIPDFCMSINLSYFQLQNDSLTQIVLDCLRKNELPGDAILLELTESGQLHNFRYFNEIFYKMNQHGIKVAIDDFGTGYSSLGYLKELNVNQIKIDRCFVTQIQQSDYDFQLIRSMIELAHTVRVGVCIEGVETVEEMQTLLPLGPDLIQGYLFGRPVSAWDFTQTYVEGQEFTLTPLPTLEQTLQRPQGKIDSNAIFQSITDNVPGGFVILGSTSPYPIFYANDGFYDLLGLSRRQFTLERGNCLETTLLSEDQPVFRSLRESLSTKHKVSMELRLTHNDGTPLWCSVSARMIGGELHCMFTDITPQKRMEQELEVKNRELTTITNSVTVGVITAAIEEEFPILYANDGYYTLLDMSKEEFSRICGSKALCALPMVDRVRVAEAITQQLSYGDTVESEHRLLQKDGSVIWVMLRGKRVLSSAGRAVLNCVLVDNTADHLVKSQLWLEQESHHKLFDRMDAIFCEYDFSTREIKFSSKFETAFGYPSRCKPFPDAAYRAGILHPQDEEVLSSFLQSLLDCRRDCTCRLRVRDKTGGYVLVSVEATPIEDEYGQMVRAVGKIRQLYDAQNINFKTVVENMDDIVYISDPKTYELLYLNRAGRSRMGVHEYQGHKCYQCLQGLDAPCPFCNNRQLTGDGFMVWERYNEHFNSYYIIKDRLIPWEDGRQVRLEIASDITQKELLSQETREKLKIEDTIIDCIHLLTQSDTLHSSISKALRSIGEFYQADRAYIFEIDSVKNCSSNTYEWCRDGITPQIDVLQGVELPLMGRWLTEFRENRVILIEDMEDIRTINLPEYETLHAQGITRLISAPLMGEGTLIGFVGVDNPEYSVSDSTLLSSLSYFIASEMKKRLLSQQLYYMRFHDGLTGLYNRNAYLQHVAQLPQQKPSSLGVVYIDINGLKKVNDLQGHGAGDALLRNTSSAFLRLFPDNHVYRMGGDEFVILCLNASQEEFSRRTQALEEFSRSSEGYGVSIGAAFSDTEIDINRLTHEADQRMYRDKQEYYCRYSTPE